jgi:hypothetical protein
MDPIQFTNPETAALFEALTEHDPFLDIPARRPATCYRGLLSGITPEAAERYLRFGGNLLQRKATPEPGREEE